MEAIMQKFLRQVLPRAEAIYGMDQIAPEIYSGRPDSPIWFVGANPRGSGNPPTIRVAVEAPDTYAAYYRDKYRSGRPLSGTGALYERLCREFAAAAGVSQAQSWQWMMKTNQYAMPTKDQRTRLRLPDPIPLDEQFRDLVETYKPVVVIGFYLAGAAMIRRSGLGPVLDGKRELIPPMSPGVTYLIDFGHIAGGRGGSQFPDGYMTRLGSQLRERLPERCRLTGDAVVPPAPAPTVPLYEGTLVPDNWLEIAPWLPVAFAVGGHRVTPRQSPKKNRITLETTHPRWLSVVRDKHAVRLTVGKHDGSALLARHAVHGRLHRQNDNSDVVSVPLAMLNELYSISPERLAAFLSDSFRSHM